MSKPEANADRPTPAYGALVYELATGGECEAVDLAAAMQRHGKSMNDLTTDINRVRCKALAASFTGGHQLS